MAGSVLLGPPELQGAGVGAASANYNKTSKLPIKGLTENFSPTFLSSGNPCLDFFFQVVPSTPPETVINLLAAAWAQDSLMALKLVCQLRGVRGTGKSDKQNFYTAALWLHAHHPKTLAFNVESFAAFGYMKDLLEILDRLAAEPDTRKQKKKKKKKKKKNKEVKNGTREERLAVEFAKIGIRVKEASEMRQKKRVAMAAAAIELYTNDQKYCLLHDRVAEFFAGLLRQDVQKLKAGDNSKISLAAKWCPSLDSSFDRSTLICESIARRVFPRDLFPEYAEVEEPHYAYRIRDRLRKEVLVPLRRALQLPEVYISAQQWSDIPYNRVASVAMRNYKQLFYKHDGERFNSYMGDVLSGKAKIAAGALLPHQLVADVQENEGNDQVAELQWRRMVSDVAVKGKLKNCIAVCDVSGSMSGTPMEVSVALGLLVSELSEEPWRGRVITFSESPQLHYIEGETLRQKTEFIRDMDFGLNTDFQKVFDRILELAKQSKLAPEKMVNRVFVFSDMEFDQASPNDWETDYEAIRRKFDESGYAAAVPEIVFWNLRASKSTPVVGDQKGVALVSGFSKNLLQLFLDEGGVVDPVAVVKEAIAGEEYQKLEVFD